MTPTTQTQMMRPKLLPWHAGKYWSAGIYTKAGAFLGCIYNFEVRADPNTTLPDFFDIVAENGFTLHLSNFEVEIRDATIRDK